MSVLKILAMNPGRDGAISFVHNGQLEFSYEAEKDSFRRYAGVSALLVVEALRAAPSLPDVVAIGGWHKLLPGFRSRVGAGYSGSPQLMGRVA